MKKTRRHWPTTPRPLALQRLAAELAATSHGLDHPERHHIGALCDAIANAGIDPGMWTANDLKNALNADMRRRGWSWPNEITRPAAFLASRLRRLPPRTAANPADAGKAAGLDQAPVKHRNSHNMLLVPTGTDGSSAARFPFTGVEDAPVVRKRTSLAGATGAPGDACVLCSGSQPVRRPFLPDRRAYVCDHCWERDDR